MAKQKLLGITVLGDFILSEGPRAILENLLRIGTTAVAVNPTVTAAAPDGVGSFQPPIDAGSSPRLFDRPLFGRHSLWVQGGVSYHPNAGLYADSPYGPRRPNELTDQHGHVIGDFITQATAAGLKVYFQVGAVQPSGLRDEDRPRLPDGTIPDNRMADTASLASEAVRAYNRAYIRDLLEAYPGITGFRPDWPEYPCYTLGEVFQDFGPHVAAWAQRHGYDFEFLRTEVGRLWDILHGRCDSRSLTNADFERDWLTEASRAIRAWLQLKADLSVDTLLHWREAITEAGGADRELSANAFMHGYSTFTGFDFARASSVCNAVSPKLYTMHWSLMVKFWAEPILAANPQLDESTVVQCLARLMNIVDGPTDGLTLDDFGYPEPDEPHPIANEPQQRKLAAVVNDVAGRCDITALVHGYGPPDDFRRRLQLVTECDGLSGIWINRYGYLSDEKLAAIAEVTS